MLQSPLNFSMENQEIPSIPGGNFRSISWTKWVCSEISTASPTFWPWPTNWNYSPEIVRCRPATGNSNGGQLTGSSYISGTGCDSSEISTAIPTFSAVADSMELVPTLCDVGRHPQIAMTACKPDIVITQERHEISAIFQRILEIFYHAP